MALDLTTAIAPDLAGRVLASILVSLVSIAMCAGGPVALLAWSRRQTIPVAACMGRLMSSDFGRDSSRPDHCHRSGPCRTSFSFHPCEPCEHGNVRWRHGRPVGLVAPTNHPCCRYTPNAVRRLEHSCSAKAEHRRSEGSLPSGADHRATTLYSAGPEGA